MTEKLVSPDIMKNKEGILELIKKELSRFFGVRTIFISNWKCKVIFCWLRERLRWLNTIRLDKHDPDEHDGEKAMEHRRRFLKIYSLEFCDIWQNFSFHRILSNENFKMEVEQTNFVTHLIIIVQLNYWLSKNPSVKIWSNKSQMVMINYSKLSASL